MRAAAVSSPTSVASMAASNADARLALAMVFMCVRRARQEDGNGFVTLAALCSRTRTGLSQSQVVSASVSTCVSQRQVMSLLIIAIRIDKKKPSASLVSSGAREHLVIRSGSAWP